MQSGYWINPFFCVIQCNNKQNHFVFTYKKSDHCLRCYSNICKFGWRLVLVWTPKRSSIDSSSRNGFVLGTIHVLLSTGVLCWNVMVHNGKCSCWSDNKWSDFLHRSELLATRLYVTVVRTDYVMGVWRSGLLVCSHMISLSGLNAQISLSASRCAALHCCQSCIIKMFFLLCLSACFEKEAVFKRVYKYIDGWRRNSSVWLGEFLFLIFYVLKLLSHESREYFFYLGDHQDGFSFFLFFGKCGVFALELLHGCYFFPVPSILLNHEHWP